MLSKSDYKIASECAKKLVYKKAGYSTANDTNEYIEMLAQGGHVIGKYAQLMYPDGIEINSVSLDEAIEQTKKLLKGNQHITLFEATFESNGKIIRVDILEKLNNILNIIEVKSKSHDSEEEIDSKKKLTEQIEDVAFQSLVLQELFPDTELHCYLYLADKSKRTMIEGLAGWFTVNSFKDDAFEIEELPARSKPQFRKPLIKFKYDSFKEKDEYLAKLKSDNILSLVRVDDEVNEIKDLVQNKSEILLSILENGISSEQYALNKICKSCEFNLAKEIKSNGYRECWKDLADITPHIFDLYYGGSIGHYKKGWYLDELIKQRKVNFFDLDIEKFKNAKGELSSRGQRQLLQYIHTKNNTEYVGSDLNEKLNRLKYPLHFIDFETYMGALPHHAGMRPYEQVAFQWSCHTINSPDAEPVHSEWINTDYSFPNFRFAEALMNKIGDSGTPLMWSSFENTLLRKILEEMDVFNYTNEKLKDWLYRITKDSDRPGRFVDLNELTLECYFHPDMKGRTSIKALLPAIWNNNPYLHEISYFKKYSSKSATFQNPYDTLLPVDIGQLENEEVVKDGTGAMRAYHEMMFGSGAENSDRKEQLKILLLQYCELDTMAMVIIWKYWMDKII